MKTTMEKTVVLFCLCGVLCGLVVGQPDDNILEYSLLEEQPSSTLVGNIIVDSGLHLQYSREIISTFRFRFLMTSDSTEYFVIEETTGLLRTSQTIDRDQICTRFQTTCDLDLNIAIQPLEYFRIIKVTVHIQDINDNTPTFPEDHTTLSISETTLPEATFALPAAEDIDSGVFGIQRYQLIPRTGGSKFGLTNETNADGDTVVRLVLKQKLDRELDSSYVVVLVAQDGGIPQKTGSLTIAVNVIDANDNNPQFTSESYSVSVDENVEVGTTVIRVTATDADEGPNGELTYSFSRSTKAISGHVFGINEETGEIYVKSELDYGANSQHDLSVVVSDQGPNSLTDYAKVVIHINDINDHPPSIEINALINSDTAQISETDPPGAFVAHALIYDLDSQERGEFSCALDSNDFRLVQLFKTQFKIVTARGFDRETQDTYRVNLICADRGEPPLTASETVFVAILDENDHSPKFNQPMYTAALKENNTMNDIVTQVNATDLDIGANGEIQYSIMNLGNFPGSLLIDSDTGVIRPGQVFDYENQSRYEYTVFATDNGSPNKTSNVSLVLNLQDINDNPPVFNKTSYNFGTFEKQNIGTEIGTVVATDDDGPRFNEVSYSFDYRSRNTDIFAIDTISGKITTKIVLDREATPFYSLVVVARNFGYPLSATVNVTVEIADRNDNAPIFLYPVNNNETVLVSNKANIGDLVSRVEAIDNDVGKNANLRYHIVAGNSDGLFNINPTDGSIFVNKDLSQYGNYYVRVGILASDEGEPSMSAITQLRFYIDTSSKRSKIGVLDDIVVVQIVSTIFALVLVAGIIALSVVLCRRKRDPHRQNHAKYNCRVEASKALMGVAPETIPVDEISSRQPPSETGSVQSISQGKNFSPDVIQTTRRFSDNAGWTEQNSMQMEPRTPTHTTFNKPAPHLPSREPINNTHPDIPQSPAHTPLTRPDVASSPGPYLEEKRHRLLYQGDGQGEVRLQARDLFDLLPARPGGGVPSDRGSLTDSGRGGSEEGDHLQHSPNNHVLLNDAASPLEHKSGCGIMMNQPTKFRVYPTSPRKTARYHGAQLPGNSLPPNGRSHGNKTQRKPHGSHTDLVHSPHRNIQYVTGSQTDNPCSTFKPDLLIRQPCDVTVTNPRHKRNVKKKPGRCPMHSVENRSRDVDSGSDVSTTTSGSYTVDLEDVDDRFHVSRDIMV